MLGFEFIGSILGVILFGLLLAFILKFFWRAEFEFRFYAGLALMAVIGPVVYSIGDGGAESVTRGVILYPSAALCVWFVTFFI